jgi:porin
MVMLALAVLVSLAVAPAAAQEEPPQTYGGDLWSRPRLTGDWGGLRDEMARRGVTLDVDLLQILQGVASGGRDTGVEYGGNVDYRLNVNTGKLHLWPGGFFNVHAMSSFGENVNRDAGATESVNAAAVFPGLTDNATALMNLTFAQFFTYWAGIFLGKVETLTGDANEFAHDFRTQFLSMGFQFNLAGALAPVSAWGGGIILLPTEDPKEAIVNIMVIDPDGTPTNNSVDDAFDDGVFLGGEGRVTVKPFGLTGHQLVGFMWSNKDRLSLEQDPSNLFTLFLQNRFPRLEDPGPILRRILERFFPQLLVPAQSANRASDTWTVFYNFDQYLWHPEGDPNRGVGVFFRFGVSDGLANPIKYAYNLGIGGKGVVPGRPRDTFGLGWSRIEYSDDLVPFLRERLDVGLEHEDVVELYYNFALTGWLDATVDLQVVNPGLTKTLNSANQLVDVDTAAVAGLRVYMRF